MFLRCSSGCDEVLDLHSGVMACPRCGDLLDVVCEPEPFQAENLKHKWRVRRCSDDPRDLSGVWRFREFLPDYDAPNAVVSMAEGNTPLVEGRKSADWAGVGNVRFKHLGWNPTACFKDLGMTVGVTEAKHVGASIVACASTGNTAGSMAAYAARAGLRARVYLPSGKVSSAKVAQALDYGAELVEIDGNFDRALDFLINSGDPDIYFLNSINPFRIEGQKTVMFELMEQLGWDPPDYVVLPGGNLGNTAAFGKGLRELKRYGLIQKVPRLVVVQARGANPFARAWRSGSGAVQPLPEPRTEATAIRIGAPKSWKKAMAAVQFSNGTVTDVSDNEIAEAKAIIGLDGIGCEPASAVTLAGIRQLAEAGYLERDAVIVAILTGHVLKDTDYIVRQRAVEQSVVSVDCCVH